MSDGFLFKSKIFLIFTKDELENLFCNFQTSKQPSFSIKLTLHFLMTAWAIMLAYFNYSRNLEVLLNINYFLYIDIAFKVIFFLLFAFNYNFRISFFKIVNTQLSKNIVLINFILADLYTLFTLTLFRFYSLNSELILLIHTLILSFRYLYAYFFILSFLKNLIASVITFFTYIIFLYLYLGVNSILMITYTILVNVVVIIINYSNELNERVNFSYVKLLQEEIFELKLLCENSKSIIIQTKSADIIYTNREFLKETSSNKVTNNLIFDFRVRENLSLYHQNSITNSRDILLSNKIFFREEEKLKGSEISKQFLNNLLKNLNSINKDLEKLNKKFYNCLERVKKNNSEKEFEFQDLSDLIFSNFSEKNSKSLTTLNTEINNYTKLNINNSETPFKDVVVNSIIQVENKINLNFKNDPSLRTTDFKSYVLFYLGKSYYFKKPSSQSQEVLIYILYSEPKTISFIIDIIDDESSKRERYATLKNCRSLFFNKISHEFKNPVCNMLEIINSLKDDNKYHISVNQNFSDSPSSSRFNSSESENSLIENMTISDVKALKYQKQQLGIKLDKLKSIVEILKYLIKDFTFYSNLKAYNEFPLACESDRLNHQDPSLPNELIRQTNTKSSLYSQSMSNYKINKECYYQEVVYNIIELFKLKTIMDQKESRLCYNLIYDGLVPSKLDISSDYFQSIFFNVMYHLYNSNISGIIQILIKYEVTDKKTKNGELMLKIVGKGNFNYENTCELFGENSQQDYKKIDQYYLDKLLESNSRSQRNIIIDNFNHNFHICLSMIYAKAANLSLKYKLLENNEIEVSLNYDLKHAKILLEESQNKLYSDMSLFKLREIFSIFESLSKDEMKKKLLINKTKIKNKKRKNNSSRNKQGPRKVNTISMGDLQEQEIKRKTSIKNCFSKQLEITIEESDDFKSLDSKGTIKYDHPLHFDYENIIILGKTFPIIEKSESNLSYLFNESSFIISKTPKNSHHLECRILDESENICSKINKENPSHRMIRSFSLDSNLDKRQLVEPLYTKNLKKEIILNHTQILNKIHSTEAKTNFHTKNIFNLQKSNKNIHSSKIINCLSSQDFNLRVLLCDDESLIINSLKRILKEISLLHADVKFEIEDARNGFECLNCIYSNIKSEKYFDILIIDETMPYIKGSHIISLLKSMIKENNFKNLTIVSYTSYSSEDKLEYIFLSGADYILTKPATSEDFSNLLLKNILKK